MPLALLRPGAPGHRALRRAERDPPPGRAALHPRRPRVPDALRRPALHRGGQLDGVRGRARAQRAAGARQHAAARDQRARCRRERILETAVRRIHEAFRYPVVAISVPDYEAGTLPHRGRGHAARRWRDETRGFAIDAGVTGRAYREQRTMHVPDVAEDPDYIALVASTAQRGGRADLLRRRGGGGAERGERRETAASTAAQVITLETLADGDRHPAAQRRAVPGAGAHQRAAGRAGPHQERAREHRGPRLPRARSRACWATRSCWSGGPTRPREERIEQARAIIHAATHMANLVDKTLKTTRLESGPLPVRVRRSSTWPRWPARWSSASAERRRHPLVAGPARGAAAGLGRPRAHRRGAREPALERGQVLAGGRRRCASSCSRARASRPW